MTTKVPLCPFCGQPVHVFREKKNTLQPEQCTCSNCCYTVGMNNFKRRPIEDELRIQVVSLTLQVIGITGVAQGLRRRLQCRRLP